MELVCELLGHEGFPGLGLAIDAVCCGALQLLEHTQALPATRLTCPALLAAARSQVCGFWEVSQGGSHATWLLRVQSGGLRGGFWRGRKAEARSASARTVTRVMVMGQGGEEGAACPLWAEMEGREKRRKGDREGSGRRKVEGRRRKGVREKGGRNEGEGEEPRAQRVLRSG